MSHERCSWLQLIVSRTLLNITFHYLTRLARTFSILRALQKLMFYYLMNVAVRLSEFVCHVVQINMYICFGVGILLDSGESLKHKYTFCFSYGCDNLCFFNILFCILSLELPPPPSNNLRSITVCFASLVVLEHVRALSCQ